nr:tetraspanin-8-like [Ipomoea batatas]
MVRVSNAIIAFLNFLTLIVAVVGIGAAVWIQFNPSATLCQKVLQKPFVILGLSLLVVSLLGLIGSCFRIKSCLVDIRLCQHLANGKNADYYKHSLSGFEFHNATYWTTPKAGPAVPHQDCKKWSNVQTELCFECESCKTAVLENLRKQWKKLAIINSCVLAFVLVVYSVGCCALKNNSRSRYDKICLNRRRPLARLRSTTVAGASLPLTRDHRQIFGGWESQALENRVPPTPHR